MAEADYWVWQSPKSMLNYACTTVCFAYDLTGDSSYAAYARNLLETNFHNFAEQMRTGKNMSFEVMWFSIFVPRLMSMVAREIEKDPEGFTEVYEQWCQKRQGMPDRLEEERPDSGPRINLGKLSTEPHC
jgi:hypothetical protein